MVCLRLAPKFVGPWPYCKAKQIKMPVIYRNDSTSLYGVEFIEPSPEWGAIDRHAELKKSAKKKMGGSPCNRDLPPPHLGVLIYLFFYS